MAARITIESAAMNQPLITLRDVEISPPTAAQPAALFPACSLQIVSHRIIGLMAPSGTGKSTLLQAIAGRLAPVSGQIIRHPNPDGSVMQLRQVQYLPQDAMASLNPAHRIGFMFDEARRAADASSDREIPNLSITQFGIGAGLLRRKPRHLSGGEALRVCLYRALLARPSVLLLDEPTQHLDPVARRDLVRLIGPLCQQHALGIVVASHDATLLKLLCQRIVHLDRSGAAT